MVNSYPATMQHHQPFNECLRRFQSPLPQTGGKSLNPKFGGQKDSFIPQEADTEPTVQLPQPKKTGWFKKLAIGASVAAGLYFFGKKASGLVSGLVTDKLAGKLAETLKTGSLGKNLGEAIAPDGLKTLLETLQKAGLKPENLSGFFSSKGGQLFLNLAQSEQGIGILKNAFLGIAGKYLPKPALELLEKQATPENIRKLLDAGVLTDLLKYGQQLYQQSAGHVRTYLKNNAEPVAEQLAQLTGFKAEQIAPYLKAFQ